MSSNFWKWLPITNLRVKTKTWLTKDQSKKMRLKVFRTLEVKIKNLKMMTIKTIFQKIYKFWVPQLKKLLVPSSSLPKIKLKNSKSSYQLWKKHRSKNKQTKKNSSKALTRLSVFIQGSTLRQMWVLTKWTKWWKKSIWVNLHVLREIFRLLYQNKRFQKFSKKSQLAVRSSKFCNLSKLLNRWGKNILRKN